MIKQRHKECFVYNTYAVLLGSLNVRVFYIKLTIVSDSVDDLILKLGRESDES